MKIKALVSFTGIFSMYKDEIRECSDKAIFSDLLSAGYVEEVKDEVKTTKKKGVKADES